MRWTERLHRHRLTMYGVALLALSRAGVALLSRHGQWERHRDELLYGAMADHWALWKLQFPPLVPGLTGAATAIGGSGTLPVRIVAAGASAMMVVAVLGIVHRAGGRILASLIAWSAMALAPVFARSATLLQPVIFDQLWGTCAIGAGMCAAEDDDPRWWLAVGGALGLGMLTKFTAIFYGGAISIAALSMPRLRRHLATPWPWLGVMLMVALAIPTLTGQWANGWPIVRQMHALRESQLAQITPQQFLLGQVVLLLPASIPVAAAVAWSRRSRMVEGTTLAKYTAAWLGAWFLWQHGKDYYLAPVYPPLIAIGAVEIESWSVRAHRWPKRLGAVGASLAVALGLVAAPLATPVLSPRTTGRYVRWLTGRRGDLDQLPPDFADMRGWTGTASMTARAFEALAPDVRLQTGVFATNYGRAGAVALYRPAVVGMPYPLSRHGDFFAWLRASPARPKHALVVGDAEDMLRLRADGFVVIPMQWREAPDAVPEERRIGIYFLPAQGQRLLERWRKLGARWE